MPSSCHGAGANARLGVDADRYAFIVVDLHHQLLAGLCRRAKYLDLCVEPAGTPSTTLLM
jgi:hypothetical protein